MTTIYKFGYNVNNEIKKIYVFYGLLNKITSEAVSEETIDLTNLFQNDPNNELFNNIFTLDEKDVVLKNNIPVSFVPEKIYLDDSIETIKKKLIKFTDIKLSFGELYLYAKKIEKLNSVSVYQNLTQNEKLFLTKDRLIQFLLNIDNVNIDNIEDKQTYNYDDILALDLDNKEHKIDIPIGQKFVALDTTFPYSVNPYNVLVFDKFLEQYASEITTTTNKNLLMSVNNILDNMIYVCGAPDVLRYAEEHELSQESTIKIYYPYLLEKSITTSALLNKNKQTLNIETEQMINKVFEKNINNVSLFYNIYEQRKNDLIYSKTGISELNFTIHPEYSFKLPLDVIFKLIHSSQRVPFIKYNPGKRQEKIYRLYTDKIATNGKKIPYLSKATIFRLMKTIGKTNTVAVYIEHLDVGEATTLPIICEFENNGDINITASFNKSINKDNINNIVASAVNPVINVVREYLMQSGYVMSLFSSLNDKNIEINAMDYSLVLPISKQIKLKQYLGCASSIFNIINDDLNKGIVMRFKRVSNYNEMDSQEAFIIELLNNGSKESELIQGLASNFGLSNEDARKKLASFVSSLQVVQNAFQNRKLKIKNNPGFLVTMVKEKFDNNLIIKISGINDIVYLETLPIYIDSLVRITQDPGSTNIQVSTINEMCKGAKVKDEKLVSDIVASTESTNKQMEIEIVAEALKFTIPEEKEEGEATGDTMLDILLGFGDEDEEEAEGEGASETAEGASETEEQTGGADDDASEAAEEEEAEASEAEEAEISEEILKTDMTGKSLSNPNPFFQRMKKREPTLFLTNKEGKFNAYSRVCPSNVRRQPVILNEEEKNKIDREHPGSYDQALEYSTNGKDKYYYICPRYWSLKDNVSLTEEEAKSGDYGDIIPLKAKKVPPGGNVFEFSDAKVHVGPDGKYLKHYPGFLKPESHPQGKCIPCCFSSWDSPEQKKRRDKCKKESAPKEKDAEGKVELESKEEVKEKEVETKPKVQPQPVEVKAPATTSMADEYIKGSDKFPLEQNRYGYLPLSLQVFLGTDNKKCQISNSNANLKPNTPCLLRRGVEPNKYQSFVACIADLWQDVTGGNKILSIAEMKEVIIKSLDLDLFMGLQNGNLITSFGKQSSDSADIKDISNIVNIDDYENTKIYKSTDKANENQMELLNNVIRAYNNFIEFLRDPQSEIDYTYLWDIITIPNPKLFSQGSNLVIIEINNDDITNNAQIICPTNHYSDNLFDVNKKTIILMKIGNYYEPIYILEDKVSQYSIIKRYSLKFKDLLPNLKVILETIKKSINNKCMPLASMPNVYKFNKNINLERLTYLLHLKNYQLQSQVINYNGKVIGVLASKNGVQGFIPCYPSSPIKTLTQGFTWMDDNYGITYKETIDFLKRVHNDSKGKIPCKPVIKVIEDGLIVGILTQTNQFVVINQPTEDIYGDDLEAINDHNFVLTDKDTITNKKIDKQRIEYIHKINLESSFYNVFRNSVRYLLGQFRNRTIRDTLENIINNPELGYHNKLKELISQLHKLMDNNVSFTKYDDEILNELSNITNCYSFTSDAASEEGTAMCSSKKFCLAKENELCALVIPETNLINGLNNEELYFGRMADEILRYNRIKSFIFQPKSFLAFGQLKYNLRDDEIILLQSLLTQEYFEDLIPANINKYIKYNNYDEAQPIKTQAYSNEEVFRKESKTTSEGEADIICKQTTKPTITGDWIKLLPKKSTEIIFSDEHPICTFDVILTLIKKDDPENQTKQAITKTHLKEILADEYMKLQEDYNFEILQILNSQGKTNLSKQVGNGQITLANAIMNNEYYATNLDIWILAHKYNIPLIFFSATKLVENGKKILVAHSVSEGDEINSYYFIKSPGVRTDNIPSYKLINTPNGLKIPLDKLNSKLQEEIREDIKENALLDFIKNFSLTEAKKRTKVAKLKLLTEESGSEVTPKNKTMKNKPKLKIIE